MAAAPDEDPAMRHPTPAQTRDGSDTGLARIRVARVTELPGLQAIERAAGAMFCDIGMPRDRPVRPVAAAGHGGPP
jgi:hypothetical protein